MHFWNIPVGMPAKWTFRYIYRLLAATRLLFLEKFYMFIIDHICSNKLPGFSLPGKNLHGAVNILEWNLRKFLIFGVDSTLVLKLSKYVRNDLEIQNCY